MKPLVFLAKSAAVGFAAVALLGAGHHDYPPYVTSKHLYAKVDFRGKHAPKLSVEKWLTGKTPETKGKVVLIDFWATWCGPCRHVIPQLGEWQKKFAKNLVVIGISDEKEETVSAFMKTTPMAYNVGIDTKRVMESKVGVEGIPHVLVISPDGIVRWQGFPEDGADELTTDKLQKIIDASKKNG